MNDILFVLALAGSLIAVLTLWLNVNQYRLQRAQGRGSPGERLNPIDASKILTDVSSDPVRNIASRHIFVESEKKNVGYVEKQKIGVYLDLHSAACDPHKRDVLAGALANFVQQTIGSQVLMGSSLVSPREGNLLVGALVAQRLDLNFLMIRTGRAPRFGYPIEGVFSPGSNAILVDDLCMEATFLSRCVRLLRRYGLNVSHCICLFERLDGNARDGLAAVAVKMHSKYTIDDDELAHFKEQGEAATERRKRHHEQ
jgi:orotate phosphoribosyltransferase